MTKGGARVGEKWGCAVGSAMAVQPAAQSLKREVSVRGNERYFCPRVNTWE